MRTSDLTRQRRLLVDVVGLRVLLEEDGYLRIGGDDGFAIGMEEGDAGPCTGTEINIEAGDVDETYERLTAAGVATDGPPEVQAWGARHVWFRDGDGRRLSVFSRPPG